MKISSSAAKKYSTCGKMYEYHYIKKIRPNWTSSALLFGDALDKALNELVLNTGVDPYETFVKGWTHAFINKKPVYVPTATSLLYANKDYDANLLVQEDFDEIKRRIDCGELKEHDFSQLVKKKKDYSWQKLTEDEKKYFNFQNWLCMKRKAWYIIEGYKVKVLPKIKKVHAVQKEIIVENGEGDVLSGFVDLIADLEGYGTVILDHKTSARDYDLDAVVKSEQLALYVHMEGENYNTQYGGFIVMKKNLNYNKIRTCSSCGHNGTGSRFKTCDKEIDGKRCGAEWNETTSPEAIFQIIVQKVDRNFEEMVVENVDDVVKAVKAGIFTRNLEKCHDYYGGKCPYLDYCMSKCKDVRGLVDESISE